MRLAQAGRSAAFAVLLATVAHVTLIGIGWAPVSPTPLQTMGLQAAALVTYVALGPIIRQDPAYHRFADSRPLPLGGCCSKTYIPNGADVVSNAPFLVFGLDGLRALRSARMQNAIEQQAWIMLFVAAVVVAFGSGYYHWRPTSKRLLWDRLPMSVGFASVLFIVIVERLPGPVPDQLLYVMVFASVATTLFWAWTDDLRPYLIVQYYGFLFVLQLLMLFESKYTRSVSWFWILACYGMAKVCEGLDQQIFERTGRILSGHTLKHLIASLLFRLAAEYVELRDIKPASV